MLFECHQDAKNRENLTMQFNPSFPFSLPGSLLFSSFSIVCLFQRGKRSKENNIHLNSIYGACMLITSFLYATIILKYHQDLPKKLFIYFYAPSEDLLPGRNETGKGRKRENLIHNKLYNILLSSERRVFMWSWWWLVMCGKLVYISFSTDWSYQQKESRAHDNLYVLSLYIFFVLTSNPFGTSYYYCDWSGERTGTLIGIFLERQLIHHSFR